MAIPHPIPIPILRQLLRLDPETGRLYWHGRGVEWFRDTPGRTAAHECARWNARYAGRDAFFGLNGTEGYRQGRILGRRYLAHRVILAMALGRWPDGEVDHRNGIRTDNRPENLREATKQQNQRNRHAVRGSSRFKGVSWSVRQDKWEAYGRETVGRQRHLGFFSEEEEAARAYDKFALAEFGEFSRLNFQEG